MANAPSAKKAMRQTAKRTALNLKFKKAYKEALKNVDKALNAGDGDMPKLITAAQKALDKAAKRGVIKKNTAARKLSRLMKKVQSVEKK